MLRFNKNKVSGFTLLEVLIAMVILSIALTAIIKSTSQNIRETAYLQKKTIANWVGLQVLNEARLHLIKLPLAPEKLEDEVLMLNERWSWGAYAKATGNPRIREFHVEVGRQGEQRKLINLVGYGYVFE